MIVFILWVRRYSWSCSVSRTLPHGSPVVAVSPLHLTSNVIAVLLLWWPLWLNMSSTQFSWLSRRAASWAVNVVSFHWINIRWDVKCACHALCLWLGLVPRMLRRFGLRFARDQICLGIVFPLVGLVGYLRRATKINFPMQTKNTIKIYNVLWHNV